MTRERRSDRRSDLNPASKAALGLLGLVSLLGAVLVVAAALNPGGQAGSAEALLAKEGDAALGSPDVVKALDRSPMNASLVRSLGLATSQAGDVERSTTLMKIAGELSWRDNVAQTWLLDRALQQGRYAEAVQHADAMLRREPNFRRTLYPSLFAVADRPEAAKAIVARLVLKPTWRSGFIDTMASSVAPEVTFDILGRLAKTQAPPTVGEITSYVGRLAALGRYRDIAEALRTLAPLERADTTLRDGGFEELPGVSPFTWRLFGEQGSTVAFEPSPRGKGGHALYLFYDGYSTPRLVEQQLLLTPGRYRLAGDLKAAKAAAASQLSWTIRCLPKGELLLASSPASSASWSRFNAAFEVPAEGCESQLLYLDTIPADQRTNIEMWYDNFAIQRERVAAS